MDQAIRFARVSVYILFFFFFLFSLFRMWEANERSKDRKRGVVGKCVCGRCGGGGYAADKSHGSFVGAFPGVWRGFGFVFVFVCYPQPPVSARGWPATNFAAFNFNPDVFSSRERLAPTGGAVISSLLM